MNLLDQLETESRQRCQTLEDAGRLPKDFTRSNFHPMTRTEATELRRLDHALQAAPDADTFAALARGQSVHPSRLRPDHARAQRRR